MYAKWGTLHVTDSPDANVSILANFDIKLNFHIKSVALMSGKLTPELVVVGAAAGLSAAVSRLTQISSVSVGSGAVPRSPQQGQAATGVVLHRTPADHLLLRQSHRHPSTSSR